MNSIPSNVYRNGHHISFQDIDCAVCKKVRLARGTRCIQCDYRYRRGVRPRGMEFVVLERVLAVLFLLLLVGACMLIGMIDPSTIDVSWILK